MLPPMHCLPDSCKQRLSTALVDIAPWFCFIFMIFGAPAWLVAFLDLTPLIWELIQFSADCQSIQSHKYPFRAQTLQLLLSLFATVLALPSTPAQTNNHVAFRPLAVGNVTKITNASSCFFKSSMVRRKSGSALRGWGLVFPTTKRWGLVRTSHRFPFLFSQSLQFQKRGFCTEECRAKQKHGEVMWKETCPNLELHKLLL